MTEGQGTEPVQDSPPQDRPSPLPPTPPEPTPPVNPTLAALIEGDQQGEHPQVEVDEIFDILPLYGTLKPGDTEQMTFTFYGHSHISSKVKAVCEVEGGPTYELTMKGEASLVQYKFDCLDIDYGKTVRNTLQLIVSQSTCAVL